MKTNKLIYFFASFVVASFFVSCAGDSIDVVNSPIAYESIGGFENSDDIAASNLITKVSFENTITDSKNGISGGLGTAVSYAPGIKGQAYRGSSSSFISYATVATSLVAIKSITVSMWINTNPHTGGAQSLFMLPKTTDFWGNIFTLVEGTGTGTTMLMKNHIQKDVTPSIPWSGQFIEHAGSNLLPNMFGSWKHVVWMYNGTSSIYSMFIDGKKLDLPASLAKRYASDPQTGGVGYGDLANSNVSKFIIGGFQQHLGVPWNSPEGWMLNYTGLMDEFRIYSTVLSDNEVVALYKLEKDNR
jgi:hypothetical protein